MIRCWLTKYRDYIISQKYRDLKNSNKYLHFVVYNQMSHEYFEVDFSMLNEYTLNKYLKIFFSKNILKKCKSKQDILECLISFIHKSSWKGKNKDNIQIAMLILLLNQSSFLKRTLIQLTEFSWSNDYLWNFDNLLQNPTLRKSCWKRDETDPTLRKSYWKRDETDPTLQNSKEDSDQTEITARYGMSTIGCRTGGCILVIYKKPIFLNDSKAGKLYERLKSSRLWYISPFDKSLNFLLRTSFNYTFHIYDSNKNICGKVLGKNSFSYAPYEKGSKTDWIEKNFMGEIDNTFTEEDEENLINMISSKSYDLQTSVPNYHLSEYMSKYITIELMDTTVDQDFFEVAIHMFPDIYDIKREFHTDCPVVEICRFIFNCIISYAKNGKTRILLLVNVWLEIFNEAWKTYSTHKLLEKNSNKDILIACLYSHFIEWLHLTNKDFTISHISEHDAIPILCKNAMTLQYMPENIKSDVRCVFIATDKNIECMQYASYKIRGFFGLATILVKKYGSVALKYLDPVLQQNKVIYTIAKAVDQSTDETIAVDDFTNQTCSFDNKKVTIGIIFRSDPENSYFKFGFDRLLNDYFDKYNTNLDKALGIAECSEETETNLYSAFVMDGYSEFFVKYYFEKTNGLNLSIISKKTHPKPNLFKSPEPIIKQKVIHVKRCDMCDSIYCHGDWNDYIRAKGLINLSPKKLKEIKKNWDKKHKMHTVKEPIVMVVDDATQPVKERKEPIVVIHSKNRRQLNKLKWERAMDKLSSFEEKCPPGFVNFEILVGNCNTKNNLLFILFYNQQEISCKINDSLYIFDRSTQDWQSSECKDCIDFYSINQSTQKLEKNRWKLLLEDGVIMELSPY